MKPLMNGIEPNSVEMDLQFDPDEMLRRYRFSVLVNDLAVTLYRMRYEIDRGGEFYKQVKLCNTTSEEFGHDMATTERTKILTAFGEVEHAQ